MLLQNPNYRGLAWPQVRWMFSTFYMGHFQPLSWLSLGLDYLIWGSNPAGYHLTSLVLHVLNAVLFFFVAKNLIAHALQLDGKMQNWSLAQAGAIAALLFSIHPLRVESVAWVTERRDVLSGFFFFLTLFCYLRSHESSENRSRRVWFALSVSAYLLSLLAKATAMTLPVVLLLLDFYPLRRLSGRFKSWLNPESQRVFKEKVPFIILAVIFAVLAIFAQHNAGALRPTRQYFFSYRIAQAAYGVVFYLWKSILPIGLSPLYELPYDFAEWMSRFVFCGIVVVGITVVLLRIRERWPAGLVCWLYYLVSLAPVLGIAQSGPQLVADRYSYLSCASWPLLIGGGYFGARQLALIRADGRQLLAVISAVILLVLTTLGTLTWQQTGVWQNTRGLWRYALAVGPPSSIAYYNLGRELEDENKFDDALAYYNQAIAINPANPDAHYNLARLLARQGKQAEAIEHYRLALEIRPNDADTHNNLGLLLASRGEVDKAAEHFEIALRVDPTYAKAEFNLGRLFARQQRLDKAVEHFERALRLEPEVAEIHEALGRVLALQGKTEQAAAHFSAAIKILRSQGRSS